MFVEVTDTKFVRDTNSMALINKDTSARDEYYAKARLAKKQNEEINNIKVELSSVKSDITEIKELMKQLLSKG